MSGNGTKKLSEHQLYDSDDNGRHLPETLGITKREYRQAVKESLNSGTAEGHIRVNGRRVYAA